MNNHTPTVTMVPLSTISYHHEIDSRSASERGKEIDKLAASIKSLGLINPVAVKPDGDGRYQLVDGRRRMAALQQIHGENDAEIPVHVCAADDFTARAMALAANTERLPLHPVDQYEAFAALERAGAPVGTIAATFSLSERQVKQRLALGNLLPEIRQAYRDDELHVELIRDFANLSLEDQAKVWNASDSRFDMSRMIREMREGLSPHSNMARFVSRDAYAQNGGTFISDLFSDPEEWKWADPALAEKLASQKIDALRKQVLDEGWAFFAVGSSYDYGHEDGLGAIDLDLLPEPDRARLEEWREKLEQNPDDAWTQDRIADFEARARHYLPEQREHLGVVIDSRYQVHYGMVQPDEIPADEDGEQEDFEQRHDLPGSIKNELAALRLLTARTRLVPEWGLAVSLFIAEQFLRMTMTYGIPRPTDFMPQGDSTAPHELHQRKEQAEAMLEICKNAGMTNVKKVESLVDKIEAMASEDRLTLLSYLISRTLTPAGMRIVEDKTGCKLSDNWTPDVENFFGRLNKKQLAQIATDEGIDLPDVDKMKKTDVAKWLANKLPEGWIPDP